MLGQEEQKKSRWVRLSVVGILLVVVICAVSFYSSNSAGSVGEKNMMVETQSDTALPDEETLDMEGYHDEMNYENENEEADMDVNDDDQEEDEEEVASDVPKKVKLCDAICGKYFKGGKLKKCKADCAKDYGGASNPKTCFRDCAKACVDLAPAGKIGQCVVNCDKKLCPRPLKFCLIMCNKIGKKHFKSPKKLYIKLCKQDCKKDKKFRNNPKKCKKKCKKACNKFSKPSSKPQCKSECGSLCPDV